MKLVVDHIHVGCSDYKSQYKFVIIIVARLHVNGFGYAQSVSICRTEVQ